jgi:hypothetical protein
MESTTNSNLKDAIVLIDENIVIPPIASEESIVYYRGTIKNTAETKLNQVIVVVKFLDEGDNIIGQKTDELADVEPNQERNFQVSVSNNDEFYQQIDHVTYEFLVN